jgi:methyl-accepting chemotaxis protein
LNSRITGKFNGDFNKIKMGMNTSLEIISETLNEVMSVSNAISNGDLKQKITGEYHGAFEKTKDDVNRTVDALNKLVQEIESIVHSGAECGDFSVKMSMQDKVGYGKHLAELINQLFTTTERGLNDVLRVAEALAKGDLTQTIDDNYVGAFDATKEGVNSTVKNLKNLIGEIKGTSEIIASAANEISTGNTNLSHRTEEQASSLQKTATNMEELSITVQQNTDNAKHANELAVGASSTAKKGVEVVNEVVKTMATINESSHKIVDIITVIDDIAFQTNILALNAAVEAARAGEQGKGFAVVAVEVRNLAQRAANAAGEIKRLIDNSVEDISNGSKQVAQAGKTMEDIVSAIQNVTVIMSGIASASIKQMFGIDQVHQAVTEMDGVTQQNATLVEEAAAAAKSLSDQTRNLANEMEHFKTR